MAKPKLSNERYVERYGRFCIFCESVDLRIGSLDQCGDMTIYQTVTCMDCKESWEDRYMLVGYEL